MLPKLCCAISGISRVSPLSSAVNVVKEAGFDGVDFALSTYAKHDGPLTREGWQDWVAGVKSYLEALALPTLQAHAPWTQTIPEDLTYLSPFPVYGRVLKACAALGWIG